MSRSRQLGFASGMPRNDRQAAMCPPGVPEIAKATGVSYRGMPVMVSGVLPVLEQGSGIRHVVIHNGIVYVSRQFDEATRKRVAGTIESIAEDLGEDPTT